MKEEESMPAASRREFTHFSKSDLINGVQFPPAGGRRKTGVSAVILSGSTMEAKEERVETKETGRPKTPKVRDPIKHEESLLRSPNLARHRHLHLLRQRQVPRSIRSRSGTLLATDVANQEPCQVSVQIPPKVQKRSQENQANAVTE